MSQTEEFMLGMTAEEREELHRAAESADESPEEYVRTALAFRQSAENGDEFGSFIEGSR